MRSNSENREAHGRRAAAGYAALWPNWLLDVTNYDPDTPWFVPIEDDDTVVFGMNVCQERCPGNLVGIVHEDGQEAAERWMDENPDAFERHRAA